MRCRKREEKIQVKVIILMPILDMNDFGTILRYYFLAGF
jgi:hypothetical protein